jgi:iron complex outermembrane recepter protein
MSLFKGKTMNSKRNLTGLLSGSSLMALSLALQCGMSAGAYAQDVEEVIVTGSRLTTGFETPTPVTVMSSEALLASNPNGIADALAQTPALSTSLLSSTPTTSATGQNGQSILNLRNLGANRNLVLLDGRRTVASNQQGTVDLNTLPQNLVSRVDVVTGGASASYGSDAVAGVVNLVLDKQFNGTKGDFGGGISRLGDLPIMKASLATGFGMFGNRLHIIASTQAYKREGLDANDTTNRKWFDNAKGLIPRVPAVAGQSSNITVNSVRNAVAAYGGLITASTAGTAAANALKGITFNPDGSPRPFVYQYWLDLHGRWRRSAS